MNIGDIVDWRVQGGGGPGYEMGVLRCKVVYTGPEIGLEPLDWDEAHDLFVPREVSEEDWKSWIGRPFVEPMWEERVTLVERARREKYIEFVLRAKTDADESYLDDFLGALTEYTIEGDVYLKYIPEGSHWKEVDRHDPYVQNYIRRTKSAIQGSSKTETSTEETLPEE